MALVEQENIGQTATGTATVFTLEVKGGCGKDAVTYSLDAFIDIKQDKMNMVPLGDTSNAHIDVFIELPELFDIHDVNQETILLNDKMKPFKIQITDFNENGIPDLRARFFKAELHNIVSAGDNQLTVSGNLNDGTRFKGADGIIVINPSSQKFFTFFDFLWELFDKFGSASAFSSFK